MSADGRCRPSPLMVSGGQRADRTRFKLVLEKIRVPRTGRGSPRKKPDSVAADKAYSNGPCRRYPRRRVIRHTIPEKTDSKAARPRKGVRGGRPPGFDEDLYKKRSTVERAINRLKQSRAAATRYDERGYVFPGHRHSGSPGRLAAHLIARTSPGRRPHCAGGCCPHRPIGCSTKPLCAAGRCYRYAAGFPGERGDRRQRDPLGPGEADRAVLSGAVSNANATFPASLPLGMLMSGRAVRARSSPSCDEVESRDRRIVQYRGLTGGRSG
ncbi:transposase [Streptomyces achromogenes]|uniref:transposase n=1 Tax=Streptomyces achromogenes TaxID=67255 RepID=UPI00369C7056